MDKQYKILGYTTDFNKCDCCGKEDLKGTISILDTIYDVVLHYGTTCAYSTDKYDTLKAANDAKKEIINAKKQYDSYIQFIRTRAIVNKWDLNKLPEIEKLFIAHVSIPENRFKPFNYV